MADLELIKKHKVNNISMCQEAKRKSRQAVALANSFIVQHRINEALPLWQILNRQDISCNAVALRDWILAHQSFETIDERLEISRELLMNIDQFVNSGMFE